MIFFKKYIKNFFEKSDKLILKFIIIDTELFMCIIAYLILHAAEKDKSN
jgi:hypothetical protein